MNNYIYHQHSLTALEREEANYNAQLREISHASAPEPIGLGFMRTSSTSSSSLSMMIQPPQPQQPRNNLYSSSNARGSRESAGVTFTPASATTPVSYESVASSNAEASVNRNISHPLPHQHSQTYQSRQQQYHHHLQSTSGMSTPSSSDLAMMVASPSLLGSPPLPSIQPVTTTSEINTRTAVTTPPNPYSIYTPPRPSAIAAAVRRRRRDSETVDVEIGTPMMIGNGGESSEMTGTVTPISSSFTTTPPPPPTRRRLHRS